MVTENAINHYKHSTKQGGIKHHQACNARLFERRVKRNLTSSKMDKYVNRHASLLTHCLQHVSAAFLIKRSRM